MDDIFAKMKKVMSGLDLLTKKVVEKGDMDTVNLRQERDEGIPDKGGGQTQVMKLDTKTFRKSLFTRVKRDFSRLEHETVTVHIHDLDVLYHQYITMMTRKSRKRV